MIIIGSTNQPQIHHPEANRTYAHRWLQIHSSICIFILTSISLHIERSMCIFLHGRSRYVSPFGVVLFFPIVAWIAQTVLIFHWLFIIHFLSGYRVLSELTSLHTFLLIYKIELNFPFRLHINVRNLLDQRGLEYYCLFSLWNLYRIHSALNIYTFSCKTSIFLLAYFFH